MNNTSVVTIWIFNLLLTICQNGQRVFPSCQVKDGVILILNEETSRQRQLCGSDSKKTLYMKEARLRTGFVVVPQQIINHGFIGLCVNVTRLSGQSCQLFKTTMVCDNFSGLDPATTADFADRVRLSLEKYLDTPVPLTDCGSFC